MAIDIARLRRQQFDQFDIPDLSGGTMNLGGMGLPPPTSSPYEVDPYEQEQPIYNRPTVDPRQPVNPTIAPPIGGPGSRGATEADELLKIINGIYTPDYTSRDRYNRLLDAAPEREGPGIMRGISAGLMGMGAKDPIDTLKIQEAVMYAPHNRAMADWTAKTQPFGQAAQYENTSNTNERILAGNIGTQLVNQERYDKQNAVAEEKNRIAQFKAESDRIRQEAYAYMQRLGHGWTPVTDGPTVIMVNKDTNQTIDTGMKTGNLTEEAKITLQNLGKIQEAQQQGANQLAVQNARNAGQLAVQTLRNARVTGNGSTRGLLPSQQKDALYNKAEEWVRRNPGESEFITLNPAQRDFEIKEPGQSLLFNNPTGMPPDRYAQFIEYLYADGGMPPPQQQGMPQPPAAPAMPRGAGPQLTVPSANDPRFQTPPGYDPHGRPPASQQQQAMPQQQQPVPQQQGGPGVMQQYPQQPLVTPQMRDAPSPQAQALAQIDQQIAALQAQLTSPAMSATQGPPLEGSIASDDQTVVGQRFRANAGMPPAPTSNPFGWPARNNSMNTQTDRAAAMAAGQAQQAGVQKQAQQQQIMTQIAQLQARQQQIVESMNAPPAAAPAAPQMQLKPPPAGMVWVQLPGAPKPGLVPAEVARQRGLKPLQ